jgi:hypothetical protein
MDFLGQDSAIDRAFGPPAHQPSHQSGGADTTGPDVTNAAAPMPRKRPTAKPATSRTVDPNAGFSADGSSATSPVAADGQKAPTRDSPASESPSPFGSQSQSQPSSSRLGNNGQQPQPPQHAVVAQMDDLERQSGALRAQIDDPATASDPQLQSHLLRRLTALMGDVQQMMAKVTTMQSQPQPQPRQHQQQQQQQQQQQPSKSATQQSSMSGTPVHGSPAPEDDQTDGGLRTTAKPFEPPAPPAAGGGSGDFGGAFAPRGGAPPQQQRYAPVNGAGGFQAANASVHWGAMGSQGGSAGAPPPQRQSGCVICLVEFKRGRMKRYESDAFVAPGNYIAVEGDRGEDCGLVVHTYQRLPDGSTGRSETLEGVTIDMAKVKPDTGRVRRIATEQEVERLHGEIATLERHALKTCRERVEQMHLDMEVVDCEYQFDRKKITFFFDSPRAVDFRELTKDLFKHFGARIWLENINSKVKNVVPDGALSHADKLLYAERGLRPPRR